MDIKIIYEDKDILIIDKPARLTVNRADTTKNEFTLQDFLEKHIPKELENEGSDFYKRNGIVHRIDKETSGILIVAKNLESFENLQKQFKERIVEKKYIALVHGNIEGEGEVNVPVGRLPWNRKRFGVLAGGKNALTRYRVIENFKKPFSLLELFPKTGRTHQIRVHLKYITHPIFGDEAYAGRKVSREDRKILDRFFLHAEKISFMHPTANKKVEFESKLPEELKKVLNLIRN